MRMLKNPVNFVLGSKQSSTYLRGYVSGCFSPAALLDGLFEHPPVPCDSMEEGEL
jgi:hypothetical protein